MTKDNSNKNYFNYRGITPEYYKKYAIPKYLRNLFIRTDISVLDIGCGFGQFINALAQTGIKNIKGIDVSNTSVNYCVDKGLHVEHVKSIEEYSVNHKKEYDFIVMSHVLEHIEKKSIIKTLLFIKTMLKDNGALIVMVPNAQSTTGCYWAYEDFTHTTLFTVGSLLYVLRAAGFQEIQLLDPECLDGLSFGKKVFRKFFLEIYKLNTLFWNKVTGSSYHAPSPTVFSYEIKVVAKGE